MLLPTAANCCRNLVPDIPPAVIEYGTDTTRTIASLLFSGAAARFPDIRFIFSHAGGTMPFLTERFARLPLTNKDLESRVPKGVVYELRKFHYDTAQAAHPMALASLLKLVPVSQVLFGTDFPFRTSADQVNGLIEYGFSAGDLRAIERSTRVTAAAAEGDGAAHRCGVMTRSGSPCTRPAGPHGVCFQHREVLSQP